MAGSRWRPRPTGRSLVSMTHRTGTAASSRDAPRAASAAPAATAASTPPVPVLDEDRCYAAIRARDARLDGKFFTCVRSTGIFCRPSCPSRTPSRNNVEFVPSAAAAVARGYRACKRCGPLAPPGTSVSDPDGRLVAEVLSLITGGALDPTPVGHIHVADLAARVHVSERTLHRLLLRRTGAGALAHARMARARRAHTLLRETGLPESAVATAAGFGSERQMFDTVRRIYGSSPSGLRRVDTGPTAGSTPPGPGSSGPGTTGSRTPSHGTMGPRTTSSRVGGTVPAALAVRRPLDGAGLADWFADRAIEGVEHVDSGRWTRAVRLPHGPAVLTVDLTAGHGPLPMTARLTDLRDYAPAVALVRRMLDLDADPVGTDEALRAALPELAGLLKTRPGVRLPGTTDLAEALLWAITGQQVTTQQTRAQITRATDLLSPALPEDLRTEHVYRLPVRPADAAARAEDWFRGPAARRRALRAALSDGPPDAHPSADATSPPLRDALLAIPGVGPWTADYALLRGLRVTDVAPPRDAALLTAARDLGLADDHAALTTLLARAAPWRSYATMLLWHHAAVVTARAGAPDRKDPR
jgi:AraC family transcriptional regulator of adaptative response / DNA-3-methyladenine glycosylase II